MTADTLDRIIEAACAVVREHADNLTQLDRAIGDGDHGLNMRRGFDAIDEARPSLRGLPLGEALQKIGMTLVMKVGGASGPLYGSLLMAMGKAAGPEGVRGLDDLARMVAEGVAAVKRRGRSEAGEKTMLDVLVPVAEAVQTAAGQGLPAAEAIARVRAMADGGFQRTRDMKATKGRASFLGERSVGHHDPGARSSQLLVHAVCDALGAS
jgi:phosphoenolpyruvate---glycerone phosphotransferase subunit DhaL